jgi:RHS repeat-associated protein
VKEMFLDNDKIRSYELKFTYGPDRFRKKTELFLDNTLVKTKKFCGTGYEEITDAGGNQSKLHYLSAADGIFAIFVTKDNSVINSKMYYIHKDYLGSYESITDENAALVEKLSFDPWGHRRDPYDWTYKSELKNYLFDRGFTGHEHLDAFNLINMNGRVYDPIVGYFTSPDPVVFVPDSFKDFNLYTYTHHNPLSFVDPTGYWDEDDYYDGDDWGYWDDWEDDTGPWELWWLGIILIPDEFFDPIWLDEVEIVGQVSNDGYDDYGSSDGYDSYDRYSDPDFEHDRGDREGETGGGDGLTLSETGTMATVMGVINTFTRGLIDWGLNQATTPWGNSISGFNKFSKGTGKFLGYYSGFVYGMQARVAYNNGDRLHTLSNGLMSFYSLVATKGGTPGLVFTAPFFVIDWTVGMDNFLLYNFNYGIEQSNQIQNGNWGVSLWRPGQGLR